MGTGATRILYQSIAKYVADRTEKKVGNNLTGASEEGSSVRDCQFRERGRTGFLMEGEGHGVIAYIRPLPMILQGRFFFLSQIGILSVRYVMSART